MGEGEGGAGVGVAGEGGEGGGDEGVGCEVLWGGLAGVLQEVVGVGNGGRTERNWDFDATLSLVVPLVDIVLVWFADS